MTVKTINGYRDIEIYQCLDYVDLYVKTTFFGGLIITREVDMGAMEDFEFLPTWLVIA
jgi:hypothetical protein